ncbi:MAG: hypothetical protein JW713_09550 [Pontiellaceae bacterium]|nr:hypothetical protein [Pontiellaceae bacterium]
MKYMIKRGKTYYLNLRKPEDLKDRLPGKGDFITKSLKTRDFVEAIVRRDEMLKDCEREFDELRALPEGSGPFGVAARGHAGSWLF